MYVCLGYLEASKESPTPWWCWLAVEYVIYGL